MNKLALIVSFICCPMLPIAQAQDGLVAHWKLAGDALESSGGELHAVNHGVRFTDDDAVF